MGAVDHVKLYLITDDKRNRGRSVEEIVEAAVAGGVKMVQYRPWNVTDGEYQDHAFNLRRITRRGGCMLVLNARPDIAIQIGADGVHVGKKSMSVAAAKYKLDDMGVVGYSAHTLEEAIKAEEDGADFVTFSPVYPTESSSDPRAATGVETVKEVSEKLKIPVFPLGGISIERILELTAVGVRRAAVVSAITESEDAEKAARDIIAALRA